MNPLEIYPATKKDIPVLFDLIKQLSEFEDLTHELEATEASLEAALFGEQPHAEVLLGYVNQVPVSYALFTYSFSTLLAKPGLYLVDLYVVSKFRKQGIGRAMLVYLAKLAKERNYGRVEWLVLNWNKSAIKLYENLGAEALNEWIPYRLAGAALDDLAGQN
ncbi:MAG TPA: GNAT family N-acetyltransferase [Gammaproteobacteria bacterium]|nr:GNAT family N-acetyltransferase [Gammaproteobacteria bacterium]